ncbi:hypothetical protein [Luteolibacter marinus]|uniref:hypothetical protein n=1 Tax=Luteolibacter marinus TaxID=2776705 RepID=UPI001868E289|nr:hypothetical protein [Luteolibacter marinus]
MKSTLALAIAIAGCQLPLLAGSENYTNFVRQYQQGTGVSWDMQNVAAKGAATALAGLEANGALFQLWTIDKEEGTDYLLDQKTVGAYLPKAEVKVVTLDPYEKFPRTRADKPFTVNITVGDLLAGTTGLPLASTSVLAEHHVVLYQEDEMSIPSGSPTAGTPLASGYITTNGLTALPFERSTIQPADGKNPAGEEHFVVHALSDGSIAQTQIAAGFVQVWPVASGSINGITEGQRIAYDPPPLTLVLNDLYPGSYSYLRIRHVASGTTKRLEQSRFVLSQEPTHTDKLITVSDYNDELSGEGTYNFELVTETPFGAEVLSSVSIEVDRVLQIRAQMTGVE